MKELKEIDLEKYQKNMMRNLHNMEKEFGVRIKNKDEMTLTQIMHEYETIITRQRFIELANQLEITTKALLEACDNDIEKVNELLERHSLTQNNEELARRLCDEFFKFLTKK